MYILHRRNMLNIEKIINSTWSFPFEIFKSETYRGSLEAAEKLHR